MCPSSRGDFRRITRAITRSRGHPRGGLPDAVGHLVDGPSPATSARSPLAPVVVEERLGLRPVHVEALRHRPLGVVLALVELAAALSQRPATARRGGDQVIAGAAAPADPPAGEALAGARGRDTSRKTTRSRGAPRSAQHAVERLGLGHRPGEAVEHEARLRVRPGRGARRRGRSPRRRARARPSPCTAWPRGRAGVFAPPPPGACRRWRPGARPTPRRAAGLGALARAGGAEEDDPQRVTPAPSSSCGGSPRSSASGGATPSAERCRGPRRPR